MRRERPRVGAGQRGPRLVDCGLGGGRALGGERAELEAGRLEQDCLQLKEESLEHLGEPADACVGVLVLLHACAGGREMHLGGVAPHRGIRDN